MAIRSVIRKYFGRSRHVEVVYFDVGGTLVCSDYAHMDLLHQALVSIGYKVARDEVVEANDLARRAVARRRRRHVARMDINLASRMWLDNLATALRLDIVGKDLERELSLAIREIETRSVVVVDPDVPALLEALRARGIRLGIISNWSADLPEYLAKRNLAHYFEAIVASEAVGSPKPHREIFLRALAAMNCKPDHAVHVGDDYWADVVGARDIGIRAILIDRDGESVHSDCATIKRLREIEGLV